MKKILTSLSLLLFIFFFTRFIPVASAELKDATLEVVPENGQSQIDYGERAFIRVTNLPTQPAGTYRVDVRKDKDTRSTDAILITVDSTGACTPSLDPSNNKLFKNKDVPFCGVPTGATSTQFLAWFNTIGLPPSYITKSEQSLYVRITDEATGAKIEKKFTLHIKASLTLNLYDIKASQEITMSASTCTPNEEVFFVWTKNEGGSTTNPEKITANDEGKAEFKKNDFSAGDYKIWVECADQQSIKSDKKDLKVSELDGEKVFTDLLAYPGGQKIVANLQNLRRDVCYAVEVGKVDDNNQIDISGKAPGKSSPKECDDDDAVIASSKSWDALNAYIDITDMQPGKYSLVLGTFNDQSRFTDAVVDVFGSTQHFIAIFASPVFTVGDATIPSAPPAFPPCIKAFKYQRDADGKLLLDANKRPIKDYKDIAAGTTGPALDKEMEGYDGCDVVGTAIGGISVNSTEFIGSIMAFLLSISGGIALILIILSGYKLMASRGDPEKIQAAKDRLTSAIIGLLFIIFSLVIVQVIGVDILRIPGFGN